MINDEIKDTIILLGIFVALALNLTKLSGPFYGMIGITFVLILLVFLFFKMRLTNSPKPPTKIIEQNCILEILDKTGSIVNFTKKQTFKPNENNITRLEEKGFFSDGEVRNIKSSIGEVNVSEKFGSKAATISFPHPLPAEVLSREFSCEFINSFTEEKEYFFQNIFSIIPKGSLTVSFPNVRPCKNMVVFLITGGVEMDISTSLIKTKTNKCTKYSIPYEKRFQGTSLRLEWEW